jgi:DNA-binding winged helix-turn-helix (wHTH) protein
MNIGHVLGPCLTGLKLAGRWPCSRSSRLKNPEVTLIIAVMNSGSELPPRITFGRFRLMPYRRELFLDDQPIKLGARAFDVLMALVDAHGSVVSKDALMAGVWPNQVVEENNLEVQISALRALFGTERTLIRTVARRGYQFTGEINCPAKEAEARTSTREKAVPASNLPHPVSELIGREAQVVEVLTLAAEHRLVTLTGPGGIGKTHVSTAMPDPRPRGRRVEHRYRDQTK